MDENIQEVVQQVPVQDIGEDINQKTETGIGDEETAYSEVLTKAKHIVQEMGEAGNYSYDSDAAAVELYMKKVLNEDEMADVEDFLESIQNSNRKKRILIEQVKNAKNKTELLKRFAATVGDAELAKELRNKPASHFKNTINKGKDTRLPRDQRASSIESKPNLSNYSNEKLLKDMDKYFAKHL